MYDLQREEDQIRTLKSELDMDDSEHNFPTEELENKKLKAYLARLNAMEQRAKGGKR